MTLKHFGILIQIHQKYDMSFNPLSEYTITTDKIGIKDFHDYEDDYISRPPYQRKSVWSKAKKQALMDSLFRRYYIPRLVIREIRLNENRTVNEVIDGQQRITTVQEFFSNSYPLPKSLENIHPDLGGAYYKNLETDVRKFIDKNLKYEVDIIKDIQDPRNSKHQNTATELFRRLQEGESLNLMEVAHAQLSSLTRNFVVKYADDQTFDYDKYVPIDNNPDKLPFFKLIGVDNTRMKHLQLMARFSMIEEGGGYAELKGSEITHFIEKRKQKGGIGNEEYENETPAIEVIKTLKLISDVFKSDTSIQNGESVPELKVEYFIISVYTLISHLRKHYVMNEDVKSKIQEFIHYFHAKWKSFDERVDTDMLSFSNHRQQGESDLKIRDRIIRQSFFEYIDSVGFSVLTKDTNRNFNEYQRIKIYRDYDGQCQQCLREGRDIKEAEVSWSEFQADHIFPHSRGGKSELHNAELLCAYHNRKKSDSI